MHDPIILPNPFCTHSAPLCTPRSGAGCRGCLLLIPPPSSLIGLSGVGAGALLGGHVRMLGRIRKRKLGPLNQATRVQNDDSTAHALCFVGV